MPKLTEVCFIGLTRPFTWLLSYKKLFCAESWQVGGWNLWVEGLLTQYLPNGGTVNLYNLWNTKMQNIVSEVVLEIGEETEEIEIIYEIIKRCRVVMCILIQKTRGESDLLVRFRLTWSGFGCHRAWASVHLVDVFLVVVCLLFLCSLSLVHCARRLFIPDLMGCCSLSPSSTMVTVFRHRCLGVLVRSPGLKVRLGRESCCPCEL